MADHAKKFPISKMSQVFGVSRSGYYRWMGRSPSKRAIQNKQLGEALGKVWENSRKVYGAPRIHRALLDQGWQVSRPRVARMMKQMNISSRIRNKWVQTTQSKHRWPVAPNLLDRSFFPAQLSQVWVSDITYIPSEQGWLYLTIVMDLADRQVLGWSLSKSLCANETTLEAFRQALIKRNPVKGMLFHSDQGVQYACEAFTTALHTYKIVQSMSRKGNCWDNAPAESFFKTLKYEAAIPTRYESYQQARMALFEFIEIWYNRIRLHSSLGYQSPIQAEQKLKSIDAA